MTKWERHRFHSRMKSLLFKGFGSVDCCYCKKSLTLDRATLEHKLDRAKGGTDDLSNLAISCLPCNNKKRHHSFEEWKRIRLEKEVKRQAYLMLKIWKKAVNNTGYTSHEGIRSI